MAKFSARPAQLAQGRGSEYGLRLREKQKLKRYYGVFEKQFIKYFHQAEHQKGNTGAAC